MNPSADVTSLMLVLLCAVFAPWANSSARNRRSTWLSLSALG